MQAVYRRAAAGHVASTASVWGRIRGFFSGSGNGATPPPAADAIASSKAAEFYGKITALQSQLEPINARVMGPLERDSDKLPPLPVVLLLGNHSAGKSTFVNYITGRHIQSTGVAPTDDSFTIIAPGKEDAEQDGPSLVGDPAMGFTGLRPFGARFLNHLRLRVRSGLAISDVLLIDSPGMIDAPITSSTSFEARGRDRGYDFPGVVKWLASRADVILLFQDPHKPGTTGETLSVMTSSLQGEEHKLHIILNKADSFRSVFDFARSYAALAWNLAKVIPRKDLPRIYTMAVPVDSAGNAVVEGARSVVGSAAAAAGGSSSGSAVVNSGGAAAVPAAPARSMLQEAAADLEATRKEIEAEVRKAPLRRVDNLISRLDDSARLLRMHCTVLGAVRKAYMSEAYKASSAVALGGITTASVAATLLGVGLPAFAAPVAALSALGTGVGVWWAQRYLAERERWFTEGGGIDEAFRRAYFLSLAERDEYTAQLFERVKPQLQTAFRTRGIRATTPASRSDMAVLEEIINDEVPSLRKAATKSISLTASPHEQSSSGFAQAVNAAVASLLYGGRAAGGGAAEENKR